MGHGLRFSALSFLEGVGWMCREHGAQNLCLVCTSSITQAFLVDVIQSLNHVWLFVTPWTAAHQASLFFTNFQNLLKLMSIQSVMPSNHLILCRPLLLLLSIFPSIRTFSNESILCIRWPKYWSFNFSISPSNEYSRLISFRTDSFDSLIDSFDRIDKMQGALY